MSRRERRKRENEAARTWKGGYRPYDLVKEFTIALGVVVALSIVLTILFSSPDDPPSTIKQWSRTDPVDFVTTAVSELDGSSGTAGYGPPYNHNADGQHIAFLYPAEVARRQPPDRHRQGLRDRAAATRSPSQPLLQAAIEHVPGGAGQAADRVDRRLHEGARQGQGDQRRRRSRSRPATTGRSRR